MYDQVMNDVCNWCIRFLYKASDYLGCLMKKLMYGCLSSIQPGLIIYFFEFYQMEKEIH